MSILRTFAVAGLLVSSLGVYGCAHISIPAPEGPVKPVSEPVIENSTINLPVTVSLKSAIHDLGRLLSRDKERDNLAQDGIESTVAGKIRGFLEKHASKIDGAILENIYLQEEVKKAWEALQGPIRLRDGLYLMLEPQEVHVSPPTEQGDAVRIVAGLVAKPKLIAGNLPVSVNQALPTLSVKSASPGTGFHIALVNELSFDLISNELTKRFEGKEYPFAGETATIEKVKLYGSGDSVVMAVSIKGTVKGTVYLTGTPAYDESTRKLIVRNIEYTVETKHILVNAAEWLVHTRLRESLAAKAEWFIGDKLDEATDLLSSALNRDLNQHVSLSGTIQAVRPCSVGMTDTSLKVVLVVEGTAEIKVF